MLDKLKKLDRKLIIGIVVIIVLISIIAIVLSMLSPAKPDFSSIDKLNKLYTALKVGDETTVNAIVGSEPPLNYTDIYVVPSYIKTALVENKSTIPTSTPEQLKQFKTNTTNLLNQLTSTKYYAQVLLPQQKQTAYFQNLSTIHKVDILQKFYGYNFKNTILPHEIIRLNKAITKDDSDFSYIFQSNIYLGSLPKVSAAKWSELTHLTIIELPQNNIAALYLLPNSFGNKVTAIVDVYTIDKNNQLTNLRSNYTDYSNIAQEQYDTKLNNLKQTVIAGKGIYY